MSIGDYNICIEKANAFLTVAEKCDECDISEFISSDMKYVFIVNAAISCELFIKAIMIHNSNDGTFSNGHNLCELYNKLPKDDKSKIEKIYCNNCNIDFNKNLSEASNAFVDWRYAMENKNLGINLTGLLELARALKKTACS
ncbi:MAG: hypothetical protein NC395_11450 [Prevotella sp.]|nr:hypothetical protein [Prevotella sp.]